MKFSQRVNGAPRDEFLTGFGRFRSEMTQDESKPRAVDGDSLPKCSWLNFIASQEVISRTSPQFLKQLFQLQRIRPERHMTGQTLEQLLQLPVLPGKCGQTSADLSSQGKMSMDWGMSMPMPSFVAIDRKPLQIW